MRSSPLPSVPVSRSKDQLKEKKGMNLKVHRDLEFILFFCVCNAAVAIFLKIA